MDTEGDTHHLQLTVCVYVYCSSPATFSASSVAARSRVWSGRRAPRASRASSAKGEGGSDLNLQGGRESGIVCATMWLTSASLRQGILESVLRERHLALLYTLEVSEGRRTLETEDPCAGAGRRRHTWLGQQGGGKHGLPGHTH